MSEAEKQRAEIVNVMRQLSAVRFDMEMLAIGLDDATLTESARDLTAMIRNLGERIR